MSSSATSTPPTKVSFTTATEFSELYTYEILSPLLDGIVPEKREDSPHPNKKVKIEPESDCNGDVVEAIDDRKPAAKVKAETAEEKTNDHIKMEEGKGLVAETNEVAQTASNTEQLVHKPVKEEIVEETEIKIGEEAELNKQIYNNRSEDAVKEQELLCSTCKRTKRMVCQWDGGIGLRMRLLANTLKLSRPDFSDWEIRYNLYKFYHHVMHPEEKTRIPLPWCVEVAVKQAYPGDGPNYHYQYYKKATKKIIMKNKYGKKK